jgi:hypothetical protein
MLSQREIADINKSHVSTIKTMLGEFLDTCPVTDVKPVRRTSEQRAEFQREANRYAEEYNSNRDRWGNITHAHMHQNQVIDVFRDTGDDTKFIPMTSLMESADRQHAKVLQKPFFVHEQSNRDRVLAKFIYENIEKLITHVPVRCKLFYLLPIQRVAIIAMTTPMPVETYTDLTISRDSMEELSDVSCRKQPFHVRYSLEANMMPSITLASYCTGSGKTIMATMAALSLICSNEKWSALQASYRDIIRSRVRETDSGLCKGEALATMQLARLAIVYVPPTMMTHWYKTARAAVFGFKEQSESNDDIVIWRGMSKYQTIREAHELHKPVIMIVPLESASKDLERKTPNIGYAVRIFDELNLPINARYDQPESIPCFTYVTQATIELLSTATDRQPRHPLRLAFKGKYAPISLAYGSIRNRSWKDVQTILEQYAMTRQFAPPEFLRRSVSRDVQHNMPRGVVIQKLSVRTGTLSATVLGSEIVKLSLPDLVASLMGSNINQEIKREILEMFARAECINSSAVLAEMEIRIQAMPATTLSENNAKQSVLRLREKLTEIFNGEMPCDPITLDAIKREDIRFLRCCTAVMDANSIPMCQGKCPLCRAPISETCGLAEAPKPATAATVATTSGAGAGAGAGASASASAPASGTVLGKRRVVDILSDDDLSSEPTNEPDATVPDPRFEFEHKIKELSAQRLYFTESVLETLKLQIELNPSSRILLCSGFDRFQHTSVRQLIGKIKKQIPQTVIFNVDEISRRPEDSAEALNVFSNIDENPEPIIFLINTNKDSSSVQGLDLHATDLTIVASRCTLAVQRQAAGRSLRMRKRPRAMREEDLFPAKHLIIVDINNER